MAPPYRIRLIDPSKSVLRRPDFEADKPWTPPPCRPSYVPDFHRKRHRAIEKVIEERKQVSEPSRKRRKRAKIPDRLGELDPRIRKRHEKWVKKVTAPDAVWEKQPPPQRRFNNLFLDLSAVESDGEGGDVSSAPSTPEVVPDSPVQANRPIAQKCPRTPPPRLSNFQIDDIDSPALECQPPSVKNKSGKCPSTVCDLCELVLTSKDQLNSHRGAKRCRNRADRKVTHICPTCKKSFDTVHNLNKHCKARNH